MGITCESSIVQERHLQGKGERRLYGSGDGLILYGALPSLFGFQHMRWKLTGDVARRAVIGDDVPCAVGGLRHAHAEFFGGLPDQLREMAGSHMKTGLVEIIILYFTVPRSEEHTSDSSHEIPSRMPSSA